MRLIDLFSREEFTTLVLVFISSLSWYGKKMYHNKATVAKNEYLEQNQFPTLQVF